MFIKKLVINGFKSFADKTVIEFKDGINVIIGPNGCGKSNIIESIRWVLGEQRMKAFRAEKSEDVIFNGTENRSPSSYAEVAFYLNNNHKLLAIDFPEVLVSRKLFRSGESLYTMNKKDCRLKDIQNLFLDTGIGKNSYSIIQQGQIDQILSSKTEERRMIFEEAAGIARSKILLKETEQKIQKSDENLFRLNDIVTEVKKQMDSLHNQAEKALEYRKLQNFIYETDKKIFGFKYKKIMLDIKDYEEKGKIFEEKVTEMRQAMSGIYSQIEIITTEINQNEEKQNQLRDDEKNLEIEEYKTGEQINTIKREQERLKKELKRLSEEKGELERKKAEMREIFESHDLQEEELNDQIIELESHQDELSAQLIELEEHIQNIAKKIATLRSENQTLEKQVSEFLKKQKEVFSKLMQSIEGKKSQISTALKEKNQVREKIGSYFIKLEGFLKKWEFVLSSSGGNNAFNTDMLNDLKTFYQNMKNFKQDFMVYESGIQEVLDFFEKEGSLVFNEEYEYQIQSSRNKIELNQNELANLEKELENKRKTRDTVIKVSSDNRISLNQVKEKKINLLANKEKLQKETAGIDQEIKRKIQEAEDKEIDLSNYDSEIYDLINAFEELKIRRDKVSKEWQSCHTSIINGTKKLKELENSQLAISNDIDRFTKRMEKIVLEYKENLLRKDMLERTYFDKYVRYITEIDLSQVEEINEKKLEDEIISARQKMEQIGAVNLLAIDEYNEVKNRFDHLDKQKQDMELAKADLLKMMEDVNRQATDSFLSVFNQIEQNFQVIFNKAFNGGKCQLKLEEPHKPLESGIDIIAQPPGKKLQSIALLSGGERAMTALSIMFAIFMIRPAPFCLLDEVDAALDEANVERFTKIIDQFKDKTQFVVITHNRLTAQTGNIFYGVTMQERGVTKVFSYKPDNLNSDKNLN